MRKFTVIILCAFLVFPFGCAKKHHDCYNADMAANHSGICTMDCPGVCGCDNKTYCNTCSANMNGIEVVSNAPCP